MPGGPDLDEIGDQMTDQKKRPQLLRTGQVGGPSIRRFARRDGVGWLRTLLSGYQTYILAHMQLAAATRCSAPEAGHE